MGGGGGGDPNAERVGSWAGESVRPLSPLRPHTSTREPSRVTCGRVTTSLLFPSKLSFVEMYTTSGTVERSCLRLPGVTDPHDPER